MACYTVARIEKYFYFSVWILAVLYSIYCFFDSTYSYFEYYNDVYEDFSKGYFSYKRDKADFEWEAVQHLLLKFYPWIFVYIIISELCRNSSMDSKNLQLWQTCFSVLYIMIQYGIAMFCLIFLQPAFFYIICNYYRGTITTWFCSGISLILINYWKRIYSQEDYVESLNISSQDLYFVILCLFWMNLKCTSYFLEEKSTDKPLDFVSYCFYTPTMFSGPFIPYKDYMNVYEPITLPLQERINKLCFNLGRCLFWYILTYFFLHFIYVNATSYQPKLVEKFDSWSLYGFGYAMGQFFHMKYVVIYGLSTSFATFQNIPVPYLPRCIGRVHLYSDMWKYFDPGLYKFLLRYIYIPLCKTCQYKLIASFVSFLFVFVWHGIEYYVFIWIIFNYIGIVLEYIGLSLYKKYFKHNCDDEMPSIRKLKCILASPLLIFSAISNFYFFAGVPIGNIFLQRVIQDSIFNNILLLFIMYCCCQVSTELRNINANKIKCIYS